MSTQWQISILNTMDIENCWITKWWSSMIYIGLYNCNPKAWTPLICGAGPAEANGKLVPVTTGALMPTRKSRSSSKMADWKVECWAICMDNNWWMLAIFVWNLSRQATKVAKKSEISRFGSRKTSTEEEGSIVAALLPKAEEALKTNWWAHNNVAAGRKWNMQEKERK